jgi:Putative mono-oxygenase ydhR
MLYWQFDYHKLGVSGRSAQQEVQMIIVFTTFSLPKPITREEARSIFLSTAPKYQGVPGLFRKHYVLSEDGATAGGVYLWNSRAEAEAIYTEAWRSFVREKYATDPTVTYFECPVVVDNVAEQVFSDE